MSASAGVWRQSLARVVHLGASEKTAPRLEPAIAQAEVDNSVSQLVRHLFFAASSPRRTGIFFAAAGTETDISSFNERIGRTLAGMSRAPVALVGRRTDLPATGIESGSRAHRSAEFWRSPAKQRRSRSSTG